MLKMKPQCERCTQATPPADLAVICSFECTFCLACSEALHGICPNCAGELVNRPRRVKSILSVAKNQVTRKLFKGQSK